MSSDDICTSSLDIGIRGVPVESLVDVANRRVFCWAHSVVVGCRSAIPPRCIRNAVPPAPCSFSRSGVVLTGSLSTLDSFLGPVV
eukprot:762386-Pyramimonas_sp.AAC.1